MRIACSLGSLLSVKQVLQCTEMLSETKIDSVWIPETWGMENFSMLGAVANSTKSQKIGSSIINIYSRSLIHDFNGVCNYRRPIRWTINSRIRY